MVVGVSLVQENATKFPALSQPPQLLRGTGLTAIYVNTIFKNWKITGGNFIARQPALPYTLEKKLFEQQS